MDVARNRKSSVQPICAAASGESHQLLRPSVARGFAILTCMDARIDAEKLTALRDGDAHVIRNAGARASDDAIRSLMMSYTAFGTREWFVVHHSHCGMALLDDQASLELLVESLTVAESRNLPQQLGGAVIAWSALRDERHSLMQDVERIRRHPLVPADVIVHGYMYQTDTGRLVQVHEGCQSAR
jgi:carbonic anhydrase